MTPAEAARLALALPGAQDDSAAPRLAFSVAGRGFAWSWLERVHPRKPRVARPEVLAVGCALEVKAELLAAQPERYFEDAHYRGYPSILVRLAAIDEEDLANLLADAWRRVAAGSGPARARRGPRKR